ncbi:MAG: carboxypeptidase regulatory-like domain-containing protein [Bacteroidota bacterium]
MKKLSLNFLAAAGLSLGLLGFTSMREGGIKGTVSPVEGATQIVAIAGTDTLKAEIVSGSFSLSNVKKGTYTIWVKAKAPYKDTSVENVAVIDSAITDVGEIKLQ